MNKSLLFFVIFAVLFYACGRNTPAGPDVAATATQIAMLSRTATVSATATEPPYTSPTMTPTYTETLTATGTATASVTGSATDTGTDTPTPSITESPTPTFTGTATPSATATCTDSPTNTVTRTITCTVTPTNTMVLITIINVSGSRRWSDGTYATTAKGYRNPSLPYTYAGDTGDGVYRLQNPAGGTMDYYCDMSTNGGGWMMVANFKYPSNYEDYFYAASNVYYGTELANPASASSWSDWRALNYVTWPAEVAVLIDMSPFSTAWEAYTKKVIYRVKNRAIMPHYGITGDLTSGDNMYYKFNPADGWTDVGASSVYTAILWYPYSSANAYLSLLHDTNNYTTYYGSGISGGDNTWYHSSFWLVR